MTAQATPWPKETIFRPVAHGPVSMASAKWHYRLWSNAVHKRPGYDPDDVIAIFNGDVPPILGEDLTSSTYQDLVTSANNCRLRALSDHASVFHALSASYDPLDGRATCLELYRRVVEGSLLRELREPKREHARMKQIGLWLDFFSDMPIFPDAAERNAKRWYLRRFAPK
jgi:hypothetical protein